MRPAAEAGAAGSAAEPRFAVLILCLAAAAVMLPELVTGLSFTDSFRYNLVWSEQFRDLARQGDLYPRWLPGSWDGLGSPTFYFYPPLYFWVVALADVLTLRLLSIDAAVSIASAAMLALSGLAMRAWLRVHVPPGAAFFGALAYMAAPYHLYDIYVRGALAESCAYAFVPLIALAIRRLAEGGRVHFFLFTAAYAGLILSHLPSALLASLFLIPPYAIFCLRYAGSPPHFLAAVAGAGAAGIGIAAFYLLPAIMLVPHISLDALVGPYFRPENWFFWRPRAWPQAEARWFFVPLALAVLLLVAGAARARRGRGRNAEALLWSAVALAGIVMIAGALPFVWKLPLLAQVQFPWRLYVIVEFAAITFLAASIPLRRNYALGAAALLLYFCLGFIGLMASERFTAYSSRSVAEAELLRQEYREAPEYLPRGLFVPPGPGGAPDPERLALPQGPEAVADAPSARLVSMRRPGGGLDVTVESPVPIAVTARRFHFPHWRVEDGEGRAVATAPEEGSRRLSWRAPAGKSSFAVRSGAAPWERRGRAVSAGVLLILLAAAAWLRLGTKARQSRGRAAR